MTVQTDTFERSCEHWSDAGRDEMEAFYELARVDYQYLAEAYHWADAFQSLASRKSKVRLIDIACGSGKFPQALLAHAGLSNLAQTADFQLDYDLLDPSAFSIREAKQALAPPFHAGAEFCCTLQDWAEEPGQYDIAWATHALYCVPAEELEQALPACAARFRLTVSASSRRDCATVITSVFMITIAPVCSTDGARLTAMARRLKRR